MTCHLHEREDAFVSAFGQRRGSGRAEREPVYAPRTPMTCAQSGAGALSTYAPQSIGRAYEGAERCDRDVVASDLIANVAHQLYAEHPENPLGGVARALGTAAADLLIERLGPDEPATDRERLAFTDRCEELVVKFRAELRRRAGLES